ncbi:MAG: tRNA lysidine(34) synthetase TilS [Proteobacteria bacterium]|nr:tRNA lysidine(34) synthetase TilS [Pseudomonadota bacterium]
MATPAGAAGEFGPQWLAAQLTALLPGFPARRLCVAFSGGADSTALLAACAQLPRAPAGLRAIHIDHRLQSAARAWPAHCRRIARRLGVPLTVRTVQVERARGTSPEAAARTARYAALAAQLAPGEVLLTAHHEEDQLETVLLQLLRGAGVPGIAAMPACVPLAGGYHARPLLGLSRAALLPWLTAQRLPWVEDPSNARESLDRNYLRRRVLPLLRARWPAAAATAGRAARHAAQAQRLLDELARTDLGRAQVGEALSARVLRTLPPDRRVNLLRFWIDAAGYLPPPSRRLEEILGALLEARPDSRPQVSWEGATVQREAQLLWLRPPAAGAAAPAAPLSWRWAAQPHCPLPPGRGRLTLRRDPRGPIDLDALPPGLTVRARRGGERLRPVRGGARRTLKGLLQQARVPAQVRAQLPLLYAGEQLLAVGDLWLDESVQAVAASPRRGRLTWRAS